MRPSFRFAQRLALAAAFAFVSACAGNVSADASDAQEARSSDLQITVSLAKASYSSSESVLAKVDITNLGNGNVRLLNWYLPDADLEENVFAVGRGAQRAAFIGPHYKRPDASPADFTLLAGGATLSRTVDLAGFYDLSTSGTYSVRFEVDAAALRGNGARGTLTSNAVSAFIEGREPKQEQPVVDATTGSVTYSGRCSIAQQNDIFAAVEQAKTYSTETRSYLAGISSGTARYTTWFGAYTSTRHATARTHFDAIADAFLNKTVNVDCRCKKSYYAYVYPTQPYNIYVCKAFWTAPMTGTDSKAGTLIHEMSHFNVVAATDDVVYGQSGCKSLAISNPDQALNNADSHEYMAENTPFQN